MTPHDPTNGVDATQYDGVYRVDLKQIGRRASALAERDAILDMLVRALGNKKESARRLGISYKALLYKIRDFGIADWRPGMSRDAPPEVVPVLSSAQQERHERHRYDDDRSTSTSTSSSTTA